MIIKCQESSSLTRAKIPSSAKNNKNLMPIADSVCKTDFPFLFLIPWKKITEVIIATISPPVNKSVSSLNLKSTVKK